MISNPLLEARDVSKAYYLGNRLQKGGVKMLRAVDGVSLTVGRGEIIGIVGESGCGKSTLGKCLLRLIDTTSGKIVFENTDILAISSSALRKLRPKMQMVFQDPYSSLNPRRRIRDIIAEPLRVHRLPNGSRRTGRDIEERTHELMELVGLAPEHLQRFPHEFSGGQRQRIGIARALALQPDLIVADESVSALDVSIQAQIINLFLDLKDKFSISYVFISHDLSVVRMISSKTAVMYLGSIVEEGQTEELFKHPAHPYTQALLSAVPTPIATETKRERIVLQGDVPSPINPPSGCRFRTRCPKATALCASERPQLREIGSGRMVACHYPG